MERIRHLAFITCAVASALSLPATAGNFQNLTSESVGVEASTAENFTANIGGDAIVLAPSTNYQAAHRVFITLDNGATFADEGYTLEQSLGGAGTGDLSEFVLITPNPVGATSLEFRVASALTASQDFILSGSSVAGQPINITVPAAAAGTQIGISAETQDSGGVFDRFSSIELFRYFNQMSATIATLADAVVDVDDNRETFTGDANTDFIILTFTETAITNEVAIDDADIINLTLSGDMSSISRIFLTTSVDNQVRGDFTIDQANNTATFDLSASDAIFSGQNSVIGVRTSGALGAIDTRSFTIQADLDFESETTKNLIAANTNAGEWTINGLQAVVSHLSLNVSGFSSWLKVINEGTVAAEVSADIIYTLADGTEGSVTGAVLGTADAGGVFTVSEAAILNAIGDPTQVVDASLTVTVAAQTNLVHITAEKKASDGRVTIPVLYNRTGANARSWLQ